MIALESLANAAIGLLVSWAATFFVRVITNRIRASDLAESGEPREAVLAAYGWR